MNALEEKLGNLMSNLCQKTHCAQWLYDCEKYIPSICNRVISENKPIVWGMREVTVVEAKAIRDIAGQLGYWVTADDNSEGYVKWENAK